MKIVCMHMHSKEKRYSIAANFCSYAPFTLADYAYLSFTEAVEITAQYFLDHVAISDYKDWFGAVVVTASKWSVYNVMH